MTSEEKYAIAKAIADELAESCLSAKIADMMIVNSKEKAKAVRQMSDANTDQSNPAVQDYRATQGAIQSGVFKLLGGYGGYKLVKQGNDALHKDAMDSIIKC